MPRAASRAVVGVLLAVVLAVSCSEENTATPNPSLSARCRALIEAFETAKTTWEQSDGTPSETDLRDAMQAAQGRLFDSGCLAS